MGDRETALEARVAAILASPTFHDYLKAQELAGEDRWATLRPDLLASLTAILIMSTDYPNLGNAGIVLVF